MEEPPLAQKQGCASDAMQQSWLPPKHRRRAFGVCWAWARLGIRVGKVAVDAYVPLFQVASLRTWYAKACDCGMYSAVRYWRTSAKVFFAYPLCWSSAAARMRSSITARSMPAMGLESVILRLDMDMRL